MIDLLVLGAGFSGLFSAWLAARSGLRVMVVVRGLGSLSLSGFRFRGVLRPSVQARLLELFPYLSPGDPDFSLPTMAGEVQRCFLAPDSEVGSHLRRGVSVSIAGFDVLPGFSPQLICERLGIHIPAGEFRSLTLPLPNPPEATSWSPLTLARAFDHEAFRTEVIRLWRGKLTGVQQLIVPGVLGLQDHRGCYARISSALQPALASPRHWLNEIPLLPPVISGLRAQIELVESLERMGVEVSLGSWVQGDLLEGLPSVTIYSGNGTRRLKAAKVILATGSFLHGGLQGDEEGMIHESVFQLPTTGKSIGGQRTEPPLWSNLSETGVVTDGKGRILDDSSQPVSLALHAAGTLLAKKRGWWAVGRLSICAETAFQAVQGLREHQVG